MAAEFLEKPQQRAMEEKRWDQPETRENVRQPKGQAVSNGENERKEKQHDDRDGDEDTLGKFDGFFRVLMLEVRHRQHEHGCQWQGDQETSGTRKSARQPSRDTNDQCGKDHIDDNCHVSTPCEYSKHPQRTNIHCIAREAHKHTLSLCSRLRAVGQADLARAQRLRLHEFQRVPNLHIFEERLSSA
jgi:hypothetical protein